MKILIIEDEAKLAQLLGDYLNQEGYQYQIEADGAQAQTAFSQFKPNLVLLDLMLPNKDGIEICREIREVSEVPVIMTTARVEEIDRLLGLEVGADDYVCKPYSPREVVARVKAVLRRVKPAENDTSALLSMDDETLTVELKGKPVELTAVEFHLFKQLYNHPKRVFSRQQLMDLMYDDHRIVSDRTIDSHIKKIRKKISQVAGDQEWIRSVYGAGYKLEIPE